MINLTKRICAKWGVAGIQAAYQIDAESEIHEPFVHDSLFPKVSPHITTRELTFLATDIVRDIVDKYPDEKNVVVQGEYGLTYALVPRLQEAGYACYAMVTKSQQLDFGITESRFIQFREYPPTKTFPIILKLFLRNDDGERRPLGTCNRLEEVVDCIYDNCLHPDVNGILDRFNFKIARGYLPCQEGMLVIEQVEIPDVLAGYRTDDESCPIYYANGPELFWVHSSGHVVRGANRWDAHSTACGLDYNADPKYADGTVFGPWETEDEADEFLSEYNRSV